MLSPKLAKKKTDGFVLSQTETDSSLELKFITELGRSLLFTFHPKKVASRVTEAVRREVAAEACALVVELESVGFVSSAFDAKNSETANFLHKSRFRKWLEFLPPQISVWTEDGQEFLLNGKNHKFEYVSPLHINGEVKGAVIVGFNEKISCDERAQRLIDAATQMAAMSINLSAHYEATINASINQAKEEHRKFTEAVLDALPVSLYVIDRDYRIVTWNRHSRNRHAGNSARSQLSGAMFLKFWRNTRMAS